jgi:hypothetical protein
MNSLVQKKMSQIWSEWQQFWFSPLSLYNVSLFRCLLGLTLLAMYLIRWQDFQYFYFNSGVLPLEYAEKILPEGYASIYPLYLKTDAGIRLQGLLHLVLIALFTLGVFGRSLTWLLFIMNAGLMQRNMSVVYGADLFANFWLFYLSFVNHNQYFSIWNWLKKTRKRVFESDVLSTMGIRLMQIQLCICYAYTGIEKLKGAQWWEGTAVWYVTGMDELIPHDLAFIKSFPLIVGVMSMATIIFEVYFIFAVWNKRLRYPWLFVGLFFHLGTAIFMDLWFFCLVVTLTYILFLPELGEQIKTARNKFWPLVKKA